MKSQERAEVTYKNPCNKSSSKFQYSFGKEQRFKQRILKTEILDKFYDLPSQISRRGAIFGKDKRDCDRQMHVESVPSWNYNPKEVKSTAQIVFAPGREVPSSTLRLAKWHRHSTAAPSTTQGQATTTPKDRKANPTSWLQAGKIPTTQRLVPDQSTTSSPLCWIATKSSLKRSERPAAVSCCLRTRADSPRHSLRNQSWIFTIQVKIGL